MWRGWRMLVFFILTAGAGTIPATPLPHINCPDGLALYNPDTQVHRCDLLFSDGLEIGATLPAKE